MKKFTDKEIEQVFRTLGLPINNEIKPLSKTMEQQKRANSKIIINAGTTSKFVYVG